MHQLRAWNEGCRRGFSLMEMTLVLLVLSILAAGGLSMWRNHDDESKTAESNRRMDVIEAAIFDFRYANNRLPCPADARLKERDTGFGKETQVAGDCDSGMPQATARNGDVAFGTVPTRALNLPDDYMYDAWGRRFSYYVDVRLTETGAMFKYSSNDECAGKIVVNNAEGTPRTERAMYALVSHGENGHGAYLSSGNRRDAGAENGGELANASVDDDFDTEFAPALMMRRRVDNADRDERFDDILRYKERWAITTLADAYNSAAMSSAKHFIKVAAAGEKSDVDSSSTCALDNMGVLWCWGNNYWGQLGDGTDEDRRSPTKVAGAMTYTDVAGGAHHFCATGTDGYVWCWGRNQAGQAAWSEEPEQMSRPSGVSYFKSVYAANTSTCAIANTDDAYCWGSRGWGKTTKVPGGHKWTKITIGPRHHCGLTVDDEAYCWGENPHRVLGDGTTTDRANPTLVTNYPSGVSHYTDIAAGGMAGMSNYEHTCALADTGDVWCWGFENSGGHFADGGGWSASSKTTPSKALFPSGVTDYTSVTTNADGMCMLDASGNAYCAGFRLGNGNPDWSATPVAVTMPGTKFTQIYAGKGVNCAIGTNGVTYCWGRNTESGQVGDGTTIDRWVPTAIDHSPCDD